VRRGNSGYAATDNEMVQSFGWSFGRRISFTVMLPTLLRSAHITGQVSRFPCWLSGNSTLEELHNKIPERTGAKNTDFS
jgi:hypothetical protein